MGECVSRSTGQSATVILLNSCHHVL